MNSYYTFSTTDDARYDTIINTGLYGCTTDGTTIYTNSDGTFTYFHPYTIHRTFRSIPTKSNIIKFALTAEERMEAYICNDFDKYYITELEDYVYQLIQEKTCDIVEELIEELKQEFVIDNGESMMESIIENIDFDSLYDLIDNILHAPVTMEDKLAEVGMSINDFI